MPVSASLACDFSLAVAIGSLGAPGASVVPGATGADGLCGFTTLPETEARGLVLATGKSRFCVLDSGLTVEGFGATGFGTAGFDVELGLCWATTGLASDVGTSLGGFIGESCATLFSFRAGRTVEALNAAPVTGLILAAGAFLAADFGFATV
ncbi:hypothetical protein [Arthrobacter sp. MYb227]|uniref:hypothetical protein n=1 Tax=Arthrobacter sp. MYb227 TaxID=1848601 RepID=UPI001C612CC0|nr:hypothetical protein [Arthrobacter sp. MYb227]